MEAVVDVVVAARPVVVLRNCSLEIVAFSGVACHLKVPDFLFPETEAQILRATGFASAWFQVASLV